MLQFLVPQVSKNWTRQRLHLTEDALPREGVGRSSIGGGGQEIGCCLFVLASDGLGIRGDGLPQTRLRGLFLAPPPPPHPPPSPK